MSSNKSIEQKAKENFNEFMENGPRLSSNYNTYILAKSVDGAKVLIGGLGSFGVGRMWFEAEERHKNHPEYDLAPVVECEE